MKPPYYKQIPLTEGFYFKLYLPQPPEQEKYCLSTRALKLFLLGVLAVTAVLLIIMGIIVTMFFGNLVDSFIYKEMELKNGSETFDMWRKPPVEPQMKVYFFNFTNPEDFLLGAKPKLQQIGPYTYRETWEKVNVSWHPNGTMSYEPTKKFQFYPEGSSGDESDLVQILNIPLMTAASQMKYAGKLVRMAMGSMLTVLKQEPFTVKTVKDLLWGYEDPLIKLGKDVMPPENVPPFEQFGLFVGKNGSSDGVYTIFSGRDSMSNYATITNWKGKEKLSFWKTDTCNKIRGTDGSAFAPNVHKNTTLELFNPDLCRVLPLVFQKDVVYDGVEGFRFVPAPSVFGTPDEFEENSCYCTNGPPCVPRGLFNISACQYGSPIAISWPHFLGADKKLLDEVEGLTPDQAKHEFYIDVQPKLGLPLAAKARVQINLMLSKVEDIKQVAGIRDIVVPLFWFESGIDTLPDVVSDRLKLATQMPETAKSAMSFSMFGLGGILLFCVAIVLWKRMRAKKYGSHGVSDAHVEFEKRTAGVTLHDAKNGRRKPRVETEREKPLASPASTSST